MNITELSLPGLLLVSPDIYRDDRGYFMEMWNEKDYRERGLEARFVQDNMSYSGYGVLRGLHFQNPHPQGKLVSVLRGEVFDVAVDIRPDSETYGEWAGVELSSRSGRQLYIPEGFAHGFIVISEFAIFHYKCTDFYNPDGEQTIRWDDPDLDIDWPIDDPVVSEKDAGGRLFKAFSASELTMAGSTDR